MPNGDGRGRPCRPTTVVVAGGGITGRSSTEFCTGYGPGFSCVTCPNGSGRGKTVYERHRLWWGDGTGERLLQQVQAAADAAAEVNCDI